jgi:hypothetical protein
MTDSSTFKRLVRARMTKTGEKYMAARHALLDEAEARDRAQFDREVAALDRPLSDAEEAEVGDA